MASEATLVVDVERDVSPTFSLKTAFEVPPGVTILFGPSGAGKSSVLATIAGFARPNRGRIALERDVWFDSEKGIDVPVERRGVSLVFQSLALFPHMSALENVAYGVQARDAHRMEVAMDALRRMKVDHVRERSPNTLSGGEAQRVALARALARAPALLLLDEPFSALDARLKGALLEDVGAFVEESKLPTVHVTHHADEARALGSRVVFIEAGRVVSVGQPNELG